MIQKVSTPSISNEQMTELSSKGTLPGVMPTRDSMLGVLGPQGPRPTISMYQEVRMPSVSSAPVQQSQQAPQPQQSVTNYNSLAGMLDGLKMPSHDMASLGQSLKSPLAPSAEFGHAHHIQQQVAPQVQAQPEGSKPNMLENLALAANPANLGNIWHDLRRGVNPIFQFAKELLSIVSASLIAAINFLVRPNRK